MQRRQPAKPAAETPVTSAWRDHRRYLIDVAYRSLGSVSDAEDVVQEAFARLLRADLDGIRDVRGWLVVVVSRLCLDQLRSAKSRRETYIGPWLPEPLIPVGADDLGPEERVTLDDSVRMALLVVLDRLSPAERVAFILHDVFQYSFNDIATIVDRSPAACRQLASRARRHVHAEGGDVQADADPVKTRRVAERFIAACATGDLEQLITVLDPEVAGQTDSGGAVPAPRMRIVGRERVAQLLLAWLKGWTVTLVPMSVNSAPGALALVDGEVVAALALTIGDGVITEIHAVANPDKLDYVKSMIATRRLSPN